MLNEDFSWLKWSVVSAALVALFAVGKPMHSQSAPEVRVGNVKITGVPDDWTHHHVVFTSPGTEQSQIQKGRQAHWQKIVNDPRYVMQQLGRNLPVEGPAAADVDSRRNWLTKERGPFYPGSHGGPGGIQFGKGGEHGREPNPPDKKKKNPPQSDINDDWSESLGTATAPTPLVWPAKWNNGTSTGSCANDFVIYPTGQAGASNQASIISYYNLYAGGCSGTVPEVDWAYNTGGTISLAPVFSSGGNKVAFIQSSAGIASLVLLSYPLTPPGTGSLTTPATPATASASGFYNAGAGCTAPCMYSVALNPGTVDDTWSDPFYDYGTDTLYVGDSTGHVHKFSPVFNGIPAEVTSSWPVQLANTATDSNQVSTPVYDPASGYVVVGTLTNISATTGGFLYEVSATTGTIHAYSAQLDDNFGIQDGVLLDPVAEQAYAFVGYDPSTQSNVVHQFALPFSTGSSGTASVVIGGLGNGANGSNGLQLSGTFDNTYYTSSTGASPTGYIYACTSGDPGVLYQIAITSGVMSTTSTAGPQIGGSGRLGLCSPITEFFNPSPGFASGTVNIATDPLGWTLPQTVTIAGTTYTFSTSAGINQVVIETSNLAPEHDQIHTTENLEAVLLNNPADCGDPGCVAGGQTANTNVTATVAANATTGSGLSPVLDLTAATAGPSGDFSLGTSNSSEIAVSGGNNGTTTEDLLFLSVFAGTPIGCSNDSFDGCVMSFNVSTPSSFSPTLAPGGVLDVTAAYPPSAPTGGIVIDNGATNLSGGESQIYFITQSPGTDPCIASNSSTLGICGVQATQSAPF